MSLTGSLQQNRKNRKFNYTRPLAFAGGFFVCSFLKSMT
nr:MAG TPA: hypothetical protein [Caudoviricetes sp.]